MKLASSSNRTTLILTILVLSATAISCSFLRGLGGERVSDKAKKLNESVPAGFEGAERDFELSQPSAFKIILLEPGQVVLGDPDAQPTDAAALGHQLRALYSSSTPDRRVVYLIAAANIPAGDVASVLDLVRDNDINIVKLVTSGRTPDEESGYFTKVPPPDRTIEVMVRKEVREELGSYRPNPLLLLVNTGSDGRPMLNNEPNEDLAELTRKLTDVFKQRELSGVFREGTNEVEKTILIDVGRGDSLRVYGDLVRTVNAVKLAGSQPIVLGDKNNFIQMPDFSTDRKGNIRPGVLRAPAQAPAPEGPNQKDLPKVISGGVLNGKATSLPKPPYPPAARAVRAAGAVSVQVLVDRDGRVISATAISGHPLLRPAATAAAREARFSPTLLSGQPVSVSGVLTYNFVP